MQIENDYDKEVYNGDIGYIDDVDPNAGESRLALMADPSVRIWRAREALAIETAPALRGLRDAHRANLAVHRARHGFVG